MIYCSKEARDCALENLQNLRGILARVPGDVISLDTIGDVNHYLSVLSDAIRGEQREVEGREIALRRKNREAC